ncbi:MAG: glycosyltransferase [Lachnospiraceae bacterium]|nr:glycosyltransferase [Lachnospiraceae bacterium]
MISIIVPIYNVASCLEKCIESICKQTYSNIEIILVDDGSTDGSSDICDKYAKRDERIRVIHQKNGRLTRARKAGMHIATGKYIGFVDGDDWIEPDMYKVLYGDMIRENVSLVLSGLYREDDKGVYSVRSATNCGSGLFEEERLIELKKHLRLNLNWSSCNKLYKKELVEEELYKVDDDLSGIEDDYFSAGCIARVNRLFVEDRTFYHAYDRHNSETHSKHPDYYLMMHRAIPYYKEMMSYGDLDMKKELQKTVINGILMGVENVLEDIFFPTFYFANNLNIGSDKKVLLYGAGSVGECYYQQIVNKQLFKVLAWVDKKLGKSSKTGHELIKPEEIKGYEFDYILLSVLNESDAKNISEELLVLGVPKEKIVWEKPMRVVEMFGL